jgi:hypothetical protein
MATRGMTVRVKTESKSTARETGEPSSHQIEQEAITASGTGPATHNESHNESEITRDDLLDMLAEQRKLVQQLIEHQTRPQTTTELAVRPSFRMIDPAPFCGGADDLDRFLTQIKRLFKLHPQHFPRGAPDQVDYAIGFLGSWKENVDEGLRKTQITNPDQWASELIKAESECLDDWDLFETEICEMYGDPYRQLDASTRALLELAQGALDSNETVKAFSNRMRSNWREAGWKTGNPDVQQVLYDMVWAGLRPGIKARIRPFAGEEGRFASIDELFRKAQDVEIKSNRDKRGTSRNQPADKNHGGNSSNSGNNGGKDRKKRPYRDTPSQSSTPSQSQSRNHSRPNLPPAPWVDRETRDKRKEQGLCWRCGGSDHRTIYCPKYSRVDIPQTRNHEERQDRDKRQRPNSRIRQ